MTIAIEIKSPDPSGCCWSYKRIPSSEKLLNSISKLNLWYAFNFFNCTYECPLNAADLCSENISTLRKLSFKRFVCGGLPLTSSGLEQTVPLYVVGQWHWKPPESSTSHSPPFWHGFGLHRDISRSVDSDVVLPVRSWTSGMISTSYPPDVL